MTLSTSRQQFLAYETQEPDEIQYGRRGGIFISTCICVGFIILAVIIALLVGIIVYFITYFKLSQKETAFWDENEPFGQTVIPSPDLRLPTTVVPSFYRLKIKTNLYNSSFTGDVSITIRANQRVKEIILHAKNLSISNNAQLIEQIYERVETFHTTRKKREVLTDSNSSIIAPNELNITEVFTTTQLPITEVKTTPENNTSLTTSIISTTSTVENITIPVVTTTTVNTPIVTLDTSPIDTQVVHSSVRNIKIVSIKQSSGDRLILTLASALKTDVDYTLELKFEGKIANSLTGFYKSSYIHDKKEERQFAVTQFQPTSARQAFPCFDEPAFKASFEISIAHPRNLTVLSNMKISTNEFMLDEPDWQWTHFERSVNMSTYLVAYTLSDFQSLETSYVSSDNVTKSIRIWTRPQFLSKARYALLITPRLLSYYEELFGVPYALDKIDLIAIPDFSNGAMENWGLVTFRETTLLYDENDKSPKEKQSVAVDVAHELAHQWFGNLVTMKWWDDLWLNEGFATYVEYVGVDKIAPEWSMLETFSNDKMNLLRTDALKNTSPVSRRVIDASEISQKFDEISYTKGANLIRMLNHTISEELFHKGLIIYLNTWKYNNAEEEDLWKAMTEAVSSNQQLKDLSVVEFMNTWTKQAGYPVVNVNRNYENGDIDFEQRLFTYAKDPYPKMTEQIWQIPISFTTVDTPESEWRTKPKLWLKTKTLRTKMNLNATQALYVNVGAIGYYRVNYDKRNWELLSSATKTGIIRSPITKSQLIDDAFSLAQMSQLNYSYALDLSTFVINGEDSKMVWDLLFNNIAFLRGNLQATSGYVHFQDFIKILIAEQLKRVNYGLKEPENDNEAMLIENLLQWECLSESQRCLKWAKDQLDSWMNATDVNINPIPSHLRSLVYNVALKHGGRREFEFLWQVFLNTTEPNIKSLIITSLPSTRELGLLNMLLEKSLTEIPKQYAVAVWCMEPPIGTKIAQDYLIKHFDKVYSTFTDLDPFMFPILLKGAFGYVRDPEELLKLKSFAMQHKEKLLPMSQTLQQLIDKANSRIRWIDLYASSVNAWFKNYVTEFTIQSSSPVTTIEPEKTNIDNNTITASIANVNMTEAPKTLPSLL